MRTFIAVDVPDDIKKQVGDYLEIIRGDFKNNVKWVDPGNLHLTLKFLGEIKESALGDLKDCVSTLAAEIDTFYVELTDVGYFPSENKPRVIWLGADEGAPRLLEIFQELETCLEDHGYDRDSKPYSPHLTVGRVKKHRKVDVPERIEELDPLGFNAGGISIIKSTLTPSGPIYEKLYEVSFNGHS